MAKMAMLKSACIVLSVFLSLSFSLAHRLLLDRARDDHKTVETLQLGAMKINPNGVGIGYGSGSGGGSGYGVGRGSGDGSTGVGVGCGQGGGSGVGCGSGNDHDCGPDVDIPDCCHDTLKEIKKGAVMVMDIAMETLPPDVAVEEKQGAISIAGISTGQDSNCLTPGSDAIAMEPSPPDVASAICIQEAITYAHVSPPKNQHTYAHVSPPKKQHTYAHVSPPKKQHTYAHVSPPSPKNHHA